MKWVSSVVGIATVKVASASTKIQLNCVRSSCAIQERRTIQSAPFFHAVCWQSQHDLTPALLYNCHGSKGTTALSFIQARFLAGTVAVEKISTYCMLQRMYWTSYQLSETLRFNLIMYQHETCKAFECLWASLLVTRNFQSYSMTIITTRDMCERIVTGEIHFL